MNLSKPLFLFDGDCGLCKWSASHLKKIDKKDKIELIPYQSLNKKQLAELNLDFATCDHAVQWIEKGPKNYAGAHAINRYFWQYWPWKSIVILFYMFPIFLLLEILIYPVVAKNRRHISKFFGLNACKIPDVIMDSRFHGKDE